MVRKLIDYGRQLAGTLTQGTSASNLMRITFDFSTSDVAEMLARIARALHLAAALEDKLLGYVGPPERELPKARLPSYGQPPPGRPEEAEAHSGVPSAQAALVSAPGVTAADGTAVAAADGSAVAAADGSVGPAALGEDGAGLARMPTAEEIADQLRRRPIGAIVADICFDLGIQPGHELWQELYLVILDNGGNPHGLYVRNMKREQVFFEASLAKRGISGDAPLWPPMPPGWTPPPAEARGTGPP